MANGGATDNRPDVPEDGLPPELYQVTQVDDAGRLFISPVIHDWNAVSSRGIDTIIDLEGGLDIGVPTVPNQILYVYFPILDEDLPDLEKLDAVASPRRDSRRPGAPRALPLRDGIQPICAGGRPDPQPAGHAGTAGGPATARPARRGTLQRELRAASRGTRPVPRRARSHRRIAAGRGRVGMMPEFTNLLTPALVVALFAWLRSDIRKLHDRLDVTAKGFNERLDATAKGFNERLDASIRDIHERMDTRFDAVLRAIADLRERMAKMEGSLEGFLAGRRDRDAA